MNQSNGTNGEASVNYSLIAEFLAVKDYVLIALYIPLVLVALSANLTVIVVVLRNHYLRRISNYFLVNLSVADLLVTLICMPEAMWRAYTPIYYFGKYTCKISAYIQCVSVGSSIFTITVMAMHRYFAITRPLFGRMYRSFNRCSTALIITGLWSSSLFVFSPILWVYDLNIENFPTEDDNVTIYFCEENWENVIIPQHLMGILWFIFVFAVPGVIILAAYSTMGQTLCADAPLFDDDSTCSFQRKRIIRSRKKVACILLILALVFAICWLPKHIMRLIDDTNTYERYEFTFDNLSEAQTKRYLLLLGHLNSALNPVIYCALSKKFRHSIQKLFCRRTCEKQRELTRMTLVRLQTIRHPQLNNSRSASQTSGKFDDLRTNNPSNSKFINQNKPS